MTIEEMKNATDMPVILAEQDGFITFINKAFESAYGWTANDLVGKPLTTIIAKKLRDAHQIGFSRFLTTAKSAILNQKLKLMMVTKDGKELETEHFIVAEKQSGRWVFGATISLVKV